jgi:hypothetical protein
VRRRIAAIITIATMVMLLAVPAAFAAQGRISQPADTVRSSTDIRVQITKESRVEPISRVRVRLRRGGENLGDWVEMSCKQGCGDDQIEQTWGPTDDRRLDPSTGAPFTSGGPLRNGEYVLQVRIERGQFLDPNEFTQRIRLAVPPSAPADVTAERDGEEVRVGWKKAPEPDITGYRVERRADGGWRELATTSDASHVDDPGPGTHTYRVVALRSDGSGGTLEKGSAEREVEVPEPGEDGDGDTGSGSGDGDGDENGEGEGGSGSGDGNGDGDDASGDGAGDGEGESAGDPEIDTEASSSSGRSGRSSPARAPSLGSDRSGGIPSVFGRTPETADPDAYSEELDFSDLAGGDEDADDDVVLSTGGGAFNRALDDERIATPIAVGLVLTATGLHLWRWLRVPAL